MTKVIKSHTKRSYKTCLLWVRHPFTVQLRCMVKDFPQFTKNIQRYFLQGNLGWHSMHCATYTVTEQ